MKLTMDNWERIANDRGFRSLKIYLNGEQYARCVEVDTERGYIDYATYMGCMIRVHRIWGNPVIVWSKPL